MIKFVAVAVCVIILIVIAIAAFVASTNEAIGKWYPRWRAIRAGVPEAVYQPLNTGPAVNAPLEFVASGICPHCGQFDTHSMREPDADTVNFKLKRMIDDSLRWTQVAYAPSLYATGKIRSLGDQPDCATVRRCSTCGHVWGEK